MIKFEFTSEKEMLGLGARLARLLRGEGVVHLSGGLGAGKTTLCRGILRAMGHSGAVKSPTFTLVEPYQILDSEVYHFDLYRLADPGELEYIGIDEYFGNNKLCLIEWPEKAIGYLPQHDLEITIDVLGEKRIIGVRSNSQSGEEICTQLIEVDESA
ncbi:MAG: tRNA (adenosine(37)-N6)-threonylcarbamoyltransferase complex ATPase subunit type 1 TsaE [Gammaproteobacteria bacterium]|jgi:tRNA threonylcarbamoyladenosine biosynthesis protein TsaE|nr:tRNA (adenosine(37)-N6)-threonylcarbamoyltransferase complex ATPase subunit type 1 TsaE [Gammaproteobacteria bacterium]MBT3867921.1 tRNA (adenosine(37)-N6)-threonylcarbamoyltransferase complex ATPase subunit type 1 TsaE [Gammaproteobacteria bacterium]MBT4377506.1 tRNA (adenosine(37)-N6)-threonylcarbamoyltransferase complex ATPase subunit type 1 TsaE [Gammaproteobacteria bacterium]MBT4617950.1 tRNA (adenosine(37)-N6)-threonylcarbamoyltransferase complex ATPase subunit type 1 TsaE [Gammaproteob|tara:strand:- start:91 stop:561 length:471 start_codon:yes stop_codon:yes gene_type:complete